MLIYLLEKWAWETEFLGRENLTVAVLGCFVALQGSGAVKESSFTLSLNNINYFGVGLENWLIS